MKTKRRMRLEIKEISAAGEFEGMLSPYGNVDNGGDVVEPGAFSKTLKDHGNKVPLLWQHQQDMPIGMLTLEDRPDGLWAKGQLLMDLPEAQKAHLLIKSGIVRGLSIGFQAVRDMLQNGVRHLKEIRLFEGSVVTLPMNEMAMIAEIKSRIERKDGDMLEMCEALCRMCARMCESALYYCYEQGGDMADSEHISSLADCMQCCDMCATAAARGSASIEDFCTLCETVCRKCAEACGQFSSDAVMMACADSCTSCAGCCADVSAAPMPDMQAKKIRTPERPALAPSTKSTEPEIHSALIEQITRHRQEKLTWKI